MALPTRIVWRAASLGATCAARSNSSRPRAFLACQHVSGVGPNRTKIDTEIFYMSASQASFPNAGPGERHATDAHESPERAHGITVLIVVGPPPGLISSR